MFGNSHFDRVRQLFADQFEQDINGFIYRKRAKGAPIRITEHERDNFVEAFNRRIRYASWSILLATFALILLVALLVPDVHSTLATVATWVGIAAILIPLMAAYFWAWSAPARELQRRAPEGPPLTKEQVRELTFSKLTYGQLGMAAVTGVAIVGRMSVETDVFRGWGMAWLISGGLLIGLAGVQAIRKYRHSLRVSAERE